MSARTLLILAVLVALGLGALWLNRDDPDPELAEPGEHFLPGLLDRINQITRVEVRAGGGERVASLERDGADGRWRVMNRWGFPADRGTLQSTLIALAEARRLEERTADRAAYPRLGVSAIDEAGAAGMELVLEGPEQSFSAIIGGPGPGGEGTYARQPGQARAWLLDQRIPRRLRIGDWLDSVLVDLPLDTVVAADIRPRTGEPVQVRADASSDHGFVVRNRPAERALLTPSMARSLARVVTDLRFEDVRPVAESGDLEPVAEARYETRAGLIVHIATFVDDGGAEVARLDAEAIDGAGEDVVNRAQDLRQRWSGWVFRLPEHKFVNASHDLERILQ